MDKVQTELVKQLTTAISLTADAVLDFQVEIGTKPNYPKETLGDALIILQSVVMDKMWEVQEYDKSEQSDRMKMAESFGDDLRQLIKTYTGIDTHKLFDK